MRFTIALLTGLLLSLHRLPAQPLERLTNFGSNPGNLKMYVYSPPNLPDTSRAPLVVVLHGCLQGAKKVAAQTGWNKLANLYGFRVLYPQQRMVNNPGKCFCWYRKNDIEKDKGEVLSVVQMVNTVQRQYAVDSAAIYITGLSAGAAMGVALMATYPEKFTAGAIFAGAPYKVATNLWNYWLAMYGWRIKSPEEWGKLVRQQNPAYRGAYPKLFVYHGKADVVVNRRNATELVKQWANLTGASPTVTKLIPRFAGYKRVEKRMYSTADSTVPVTYYRIKRMGHALPINPGKCPQQGGKRVAFSADFNFHSTFWAAYDFGLFTLPTITGPTNAHPNQKGLVYSVNCPAGTKLQWHLPPGCKIAHSNDNSITVNWGRVPGSISVTELPQKGECPQPFAPKYVDCCNGY